MTKRQIFDLQAPYTPSPDQENAISEITKYIKEGHKYQTLWGVTGSGKTFTMANVIKEINKPTLVIAHNKTLAAQLAQEFKEFFPNNAVHYFVSYYDYYQPEAYVAKTDTYIEKEATINEEIDRLRHAATQDLLTRRDVIIVASVSCIYGIGDIGLYMDSTITLEVGKEYEIETILRKLVAIQYKRSMHDFKPGNFIIKGDVLEIFPASSENVITIDFWGNEVSSITVRDHLTGEVYENLNDVIIFPAKHTVTTSEKIMDILPAIQHELDERLKIFEKQGDILKHERLKTKVEYDMEMMMEVGYVNGIENYSRFLDGRMPGVAPATLIDFFGDDYLCFVDESHMTFSQIGGMYAGDRSRKENLVENGFRLPSALDNRPLKFDEFENKLKSVVAVSATPGPYEIGKSCDDELSSFEFISDISDKDYKIVIEKENKFHFSKRGLSKRDYCIIKNGKEIIAFVQVFKLDRDNFEIGHLRVTTPFRGHDLGRKLMIFAIEKKLPKGKNLFLVALESLKGYYEKLGFKEVKDFPIHLAETIKKGKEENKKFIAMSLYENSFHKTESNKEKFFNFNPLTDGVWKSSEDCRVVPQMMRPTGLLDPEIILKPMEFMVDDIMNNISEVIEKNERMLVTTITKRSSEELTDYLVENGVKVKYLHSEVETLDRLEILKELREGKIDVIVGVNLLREGLDLPEVSKICILDADKQGFLRSETSLIQIIGRAARNSNGKVYMYSEKLKKFDKTKYIKEIDGLYRIDKGKLANEEGLIISEAMKKAINLTYYRRGLQEEYNSQNGITPKTIFSNIKDMGIKSKKKDYDKVDNKTLDKELKRLELEMDIAAANLEFEKAAELRDLILELKSQRKKK